MGDSDESAVERADTDPAPAADETGKAKKRELPPYLRVVK
jgi:hypothetical protein